MSEIKLVMISSTVRDLPRHRTQAMDACLSQGMFPSMMEHLPASHEDAVKVSLKMVEEADIYIGIFAYRYGYTPDGYNLSITEMEYNRAIDCGIPVLVFLIDETQSVGEIDFETGEGAERLSQLKERLKAEHVVNFFTSAEDLRARIIASLSKIRTSEKTQPLIESREFSAPIQTNMALLKKTIEQLTEEQYQILDVLRYQKRVAIEGCAGSGKTLLAAEKAVRLDQRAGLRTLLLCHSRNLAGYLQHLVAGTSVRVFDFSSWINFIIGNSTDHSDPWKHYDIPEEGGLNKAFDRLDKQGEKYDAIIVDEGQDFREIWWVIVEAALKSPEHGVLYIFYDSFQQLHTDLRIDRVKYPINLAPIVLSKNCRNSGRIFDIVRAIYPHFIETFTLLKDKGVVKHKIFSSSTYDEKMALSEAVQEALQIQGLKTNRVVA